MRFYYDVNLYDRSETVTSLEYIRCNNTHPLHDKTQGIPVFERRVAEAK